MTSSTTAAFTSVFVVVRRERAIIALYTQVSPTGRPGPLRRRTLRLCPPCDPPLTVSKERPKVLSCSTRGHLFLQESLPDRSVPVKPIVAGVPPRLPLRGFRETSLVRRRVCRCRDGRTAGRVWRVDRRTRPPRSTLIVETSFNLKTSDPGRMFEPTGLLVDRAIYDTLLTFENGDMTKPVPDLASSYTASTDAKTFTFKLRHRRGLLRRHPGHLGRCASSPCNGWPTSKATRRS